ncbi:unnamed protein product [Closterium sp. NIES-65]|nr:unnamed protein product [Closterium sp. NIES-65]
MTSSTSSRSPAPARLVPFCAVLLLATLLWPSLATSVARGGSGRRVLQEPPVSDEIVSAETSALLALKQALGNHPAFSLAGRWSDGPSPNRQGQLSQPCADTWQFVTCDSTGRVIAIDMSNPFLASLNASWARGATVAAVAQQLTARGASQQAVAAAVAAGVVGPLRGEITNLTFNRIDSLPADVTAMTALETLHLDMNRITGSLPAGLSALSRLSSLVLGQNQIVGQLPEELGALTDLVTLSLYRLPVTADFPPSWAALASLSFFSFSSAAASGPFPAFLTQLPNIQHIYLHSNRLSGSLPADLWRFPSLTDVDISNNFFNGSVPLPPPERQADFRYFFNCFSSASSPPSDVPVAAEGQLDAAACTQFYSPPPELDASTAAAAAGTQQQPPPSDSTWGSSFFTVCLLIALTILLVAVSFTCCRLVQQRRQQNRDMQQQQEQMRGDVDSEAAAEANGANAVSVCERMRDMQQQQQC